MSITRYQRLTGKPLQIKACGDCTESEIRALCSGLVNFSPTPSALFLHQIASFCRSSKHPQARTMRAFPTHPGCIKSAMLSEAGRRGEAARQYQKLTLFRIDGNLF
jgi:hypothetical protein